MYKKITKLLTLALLFMSFGLSAMAQDIIYLKNGNEIKSIVQDVLKEGVFYKRFDNQTGPVYYLSTSDILLIIYENGTKDIFNEVAKPIEPKVEPQQPPKPATISSTDLKNEFYSIGTNDREMLNFFRRNNFMEYYNRFESACRQRNSGKALLGIGLVWTIMGTGLVVGGIIDSNVPCAISGYAFMGVGEILTIISIPVSAGAGGRKRAIKNNFVREHLSGYSHQSSLNLGISNSGGLGLKLKF